MKKYFLVDKKLLGNLIFIESFMTYDYPRIFVCKNEDKNIKYLFTEYISEDTFDAWLVQEITDKRYADIKNDIVSLQQSYREAEYDEYYLVSKDYNKDITNVKKVNELPKGIINNSNTFV